MMVGSSLSKKFERWEKSWPSLAVALLIVLASAGVVLLTMATKLQGLHHVTALDHAQLARHLAARRGLGDRLGATDLAGVQWKSHQASRAVQRAGASVGAGGGLQAAACDEPGHRRRGPALVDGVGLADLFHRPVLVQAGGVVGGGGLCVQLRPALSLRSAACRNHCWRWRCFWRCGCCCPAEEAEIHRAAEKPSLPRWRTALVGLVCGLMFLTHYLMLVTTVVLGVFLLVTQPRKRATMMAFVFGWLLPVEPWLVRSCWLMRSPLFTLYWYEALTHTPSYPGELLWRSVAQPTDFFWFGLLHPLEILRKLYAGIAQFQDSVASVLGLVIIILFPAALLGAATVARGVGWRG